jgi:hypothetical protein
MVFKERSMHSSRMRTAFGLDWEFPQLDVAFSLFLSRSLIPLYEKSMKSTWLEPQGAAMAAAEGWGRWRE